MKKADLKQLIKPLVKECVNEVLLEEGLLSGVVAEVAKGMQNNLIVEAQTRPQVDSSQVIQKQVIKSKEHNLVTRKKLMDAIGADAYNGVDLFEGTTAASPHSEPRPGSIDLGASSDSGVDISSLIGGASRMWHAMK